MVTAQVGWIAHERRRDFAKFEGSLVTASMMFQLCFLAVEKKVSLLKSLSGLGIDLAMEIATDGF